MFTLRGNQEFDFGHAKFYMPIRHPNEDVALATGEDTGFLTRDR